MSQFRVRSWPTARRLATSWQVLLGILLVLSSGGLLGLIVLQGQVQKRADSDAIETGRIVAALTVEPGLTEDMLTSPAGLAAGNTIDLDAAVDALRSQHHIEGLEVWGADGHLLYSDSDHAPAEAILPAAELNRFQANQVWVASTPDAPRREVATVDVFVPFEAGTDNTPDALVEVLLPRAPIAAAVTRTSQLLALGAGLLLLIVGTALVVLRRKLRLRDHQIAHDRLTGLLNWGGFRDAVTTGCAAAPARTPRASALLVLDLDSFKLVNDTLGHPAGDDLLQQVATALLGAVRPQDLVARLGGDEFAVHLTELIDDAAADVIAQDVLEGIRSRLINVAGVDLRVDVSIGVAHAPRDGTDTDSLIRCADIAMYRAKRLGTGVATYEEMADEHNAWDLGLLGQLGAAIDNDQLVLHYQPKASMATRAITGVEALVRWQHPELGLVPPSSFIGLAENTGLIKPLTHWVLRSAVAQAAKWMAQGLWLPVAVNVSPRSLLDPGLVTYIIDLLADAALPASLLEIEITESAIMADPDGAAQVLRALRKLGVHISIDDFGTGYTSLAYLENLPADVLKIDRTFITNLTEGDKREAITRSVIDLAHRLGLTAIAEGVETKAIWHRLNDLGCDEGQGYLLAKPMPGAAMCGWLRDHDRMLASHPTDAALVAF